MAHVRGEWNSYWQRVLGCFISSSSYVCDIAVSSACDAGLRFKKNVDGFADGQPSKPSCGLCGIRPCDYSNRKQVVSQVAPDRWRSVSISIDANGSSAASVWWRCKTFDTRGICAESESATGNAGECTGYKNTANQAGVGMPIDSQCSRSLPTVSTLCKSTRFFRALCRRDRIRAVYTDRNAMAARRAAY